MAAWRWGKAFCKWLNDGADEKTRPQWIGDYLRKEANAGKIKQVTYLTMHAGTPAVGDVASANATNRL